MKPTCELYPDMLGGVEVGETGWPVIHLDVEFPKKSITTTALCTGAQSYWKMDLLGCHGQI